MSLRASLRQLNYPREFRIHPFEYPPELPTTLENFIKVTAASAQSGQQAPNLSLLAEVGTGLWRMQQKMRQPGSNEPTDEMRRAYRHLESTLDAFSNADIQIIDHTGDIVPEGGGLKLKVLAYQPQSGINQRVVQETIKPSIYYKGQMIQMGEVIVSVPEEHN